MMNFLIRPWEHGQGLQLRRDGGRPGAGLRGRDAPGRRGGGHCWRRDGSPDLTAPLAARLGPPHVMVQHFLFPWRLLPLAKSAGEVTQPGSIHIARPCSTELSPRR